MISSLSQPVRHGLPLHAELHQPLIHELAYLKINHMNYVYADWQQQTVSITGTETKWLEACFMQGLWHQIHSRLHGFIQVWPIDTKWTSIYQQHRQQLGLTPTFFKTDVCIADDQAWHLLEIEHQQPLSLCDMNPLIETMGYFKDECARLSLQHPDLTVCLEQPIQPPAPTPPAAQPAFDLDQIIEADPIPLNAHEKVALDYRLQWCSDDEIAQRMNLSLTTVRQLFVSIADKHRHTYIPTSVYQRHLPQAWQCFTQQSPSV